MVAEKFSYNRMSAQYSDLLAERTDWETEWRQISEFLLPGRGIYQQTSKPRKRKLTSPRVVNGSAEDALYVLTSGMHGGLTSPSRAWFKLAWADERLNQNEPLKAWLQECDKRLNAKLQASNFYSVINSFYVEYAGFGTSCMFVGDDTPSVNIPFRFELLTAGEYAFALGADGKTGTFFRSIFMSPYQLYQRFGSKCSTSVIDMVKNNKAGAHRVDRTVMECVYALKHQDKDYTRVFYELEGDSEFKPSGQKTPLEVSGFYEFPYPTARWGTIGSDTYGIGPGSRALPDIKRLQEMEKAFLMATHKSINPPLNAPARMKGKLNTLPGGYNYYANPNEKVTEVYQVRFDYAGVSASIERVEQRIQRNFFNDIFLTASRDPNASPLKARQVDTQDQEKMLRLGPVIERLQSEFLQPLIERCFNICLRKQLFEELPPDLAEQAGEYTITLVSPLASAQKMVALQGIQSFLGFVGQAAQFDQGVVDNVDIDLATREYADISGVNLGILRPADAVKNLRAERAAAEAKRAQEQQNMVAASEGSRLDAEQASASKTQAEAGVAQLEAQEIQQKLGAY